MRVSLQMRHAPGGRFRWRWGGRTRESAFNHPHLTLTPAGAAHEWVWDSRAESLHVLLPPALLADAAGHPGDPPPELRPSLGDADDPRAIGLMRLLEAEVRSADVEPTHVQSLLGALAHRLLRTFGTAPVIEPRAKRGLTGRQLATVEELMRARMADGLLVDDMAEALDLSATHFARLFHRSTGNAPHQHLMALQLERAQELLVAHPDLTVLTVAVRCGFSSESHLGRRFRERFRVLPRRLPPCGARRTVTRP